MRILKILTDSGYAIELSHDEERNTCHMKIIDTNRLRHSEPTSVELTEDETVELSDFLGAMSDIMESDIDESPGDFSESDYMKLLNRDVKPGSTIYLPFNQEPFNFGEIGADAINRFIDSAKTHIDFPNPDDIENWLNNESDKE